MLFDKLLLRADVENECFWIKWTRSKHTEKSISRYSLYFHTMFFVHSQTSTKLLHRNQRCMHVSVAVRDVYYYYIQSN